MATDRERQNALLALALVKGTIDGDVSADELLVETFDDLDQAARAHAYLAGFLLTALSNERRESPEQTLHWIRSLLKAS